MNLPRVAVICDLPEENWHSMDLVAEMLLKHLRAEHAESVSAEGIRPHLKRRLGFWPRPSAVAHNADRLFNRFWDYPRLLRRERERFDLFHLVDHSYAQLVRELPAERTIVTCHDLDTFRCVLEPEREPRGRWFVAMTERILDGLRRAARVTCDSVATRDELLKFELVPASRAVVIPNGVHPSCSPEPEAAADAEAVRLLGDESDAVVDLLHVGSTIPRKRLDVLLRVFAEVQKEFKGARLLRVGGAFTDEQSKLAERLGLSQAILVLPQLSRPVLAAVYRRAALVLQPSEREGFGLPVVEALACGAPVVASDLDVLREVGGEAAVYCPVADISAWSEALSALLHERRDEPERWEARRRAGLTQA
ncbi:MAG: glycosyltransferase family 4 protein, partial [Acidobacteria bacterium]|nr:glycosyltransferase family 4 protein [Acidobacteriota bacterium]